MITSFAHKGLERLFHEDDARGVPPASAAKLRRILAVLDTAEEISEVGLYPGWRLHRLRGERQGMWGVTVTGNWRVVFRFTDGEAGAVDLVDYH